MATALDEAKELDDDEFIYQLQLEEIRKVSNQEEDIDALCDDFQDFLPTGPYQAPSVSDALRFIIDRGRRNNIMNFNENVIVPTNTTLTHIPREQSNFYGQDEDDEDPDMNNSQPSCSDSISVQFNPDSLESLGSLREMHGGDFSDTGSARKNPEIFSPIQYPTENPFCESTRCDSMLQKQFNVIRGNATEGMERNVHENQSPRDSPVNTQFNCIDDRLTAQQVQLEDQNHLLEQDRILAEKVQLEADLESAKELDKHHKRRRKSRQNGLFHLGNIVNIRQNNVDLPESWSNSLPFGNERETERQNIHPFQQHPNQTQSQLFPRGGTTDQGGQNPLFDFFNPLRVTRPTTPGPVAPEAVHQHRRRHPMASLIRPIPNQRGADYHTRHLIGQRAFRRHSSNFQGDDIDVDGLEYEDLLELGEQLGEVKFRGLEQSDIATLPKETINDIKQIRETQCVICHEDFQLKDVVRKLSCSHMYHIHCIDPWLKHKAECPICKENIKGDNSKKG